MTGEDTIFGKTVGKNTVKRMCWYFQEMTAALLPSAVPSTVTCPIRKQAEHTPREGNTGPAHWAGLALGLTELIKELPQECRLALCSYFDIRFFGLCKHKAAKTKEAFQLYFFLTSFGI